MRRILFCVILIGIMIGVPHAPALEAAKESEQKSSTAPLLRANEALTGSPVSQVPNGGSAPEDLISTIAVPLTPSNPPLSAVGQADSNECPTQVIIPSFIAENSSDRSPAAKTPPPGGKDFIPQAVSVVNEAQGLELLDAALKKRTAIADAANQDQQTLSSPYQSLTPAQLIETFGRASELLTQNVTTLKNATAGLEGERDRFANLYQNALDKAQAAQNILETEKRQALAKNLLPFSTLFNAAPDSSALAKTQSLLNLFSPHSKLLSSNSPDALVDRILMYSGLPEDFKLNVFNKLQLAELRTLKSPDGKSTTLPLLHNGYIFGAGDTSLDCSSFISSLLPIEARKTRFTTLDFRSMWVYLKSGFLPKPPLMEKSHAEIVKSTAQAFVPLDLYRGDTLAIGDLLVFRLPWLTAGHVFLVRKYSAKNQTAHVIEAAQSAGTVREREFRLSVSPETSRVQYFRPGLFGLRLKPTQTAACKYTTGTSPLINRKPTSLDLPVGGLHP